MGGKDGRSAQGAAKEDQMESKHKVLSILRFCFILVYIFSLVTPAAVVRAQDEIPPVVTEPAPVVEDPTEPVVPPEETVPVEDFTPVEEGVIPVTGVEVPAQTEVTAAVEAMVDTGAVLLDSAGEPIPLASSEAVEIIQNTDPWFATTVGGHKDYHFFVQNCGTFVLPFTVTLPDEVYCHTSGTPIQASIDYVGNDLTTALDDNTIHVLNGTYQENVTINVDGLTLLGDPGDLTLAGAASSVTAPVLSGGFLGDTGTGIHITAQGVTVSGFIIKDFDVGIYVDVLVGQTTTSLTNNTIKDNEIGVDIVGGQGKPGTNLLYNTFSGNTLYAIRNSVGDHNVQFADASGSNFGCEEGPIVAHQITEEVCVPSNVCREYYTNGPKAGQCHFYEDDICHTEVVDVEYYLWADGRPTGSSEPIDLADYPGCQVLYGWDGNGTLYDNNGMGGTYDPFKIVLGDLQACPEGQALVNGVCVIDNCPLDPLKTEAGICGCGTADTDGDGDGTADCNDLCPSDSGKIAEGICGCGVADTDGDGDGTADCNDLCPSDSGKIAEGICGCGVADTDGDGDGTADCDDLCPSDSEKVTEGICGCGVADTDTDGDGTPDCNDTCDDTIDTDGDGISDCVDTCDDTIDTDGDGISDCVDTCDDTIDTDGDGTADCEDLCPTDVGKVEGGVCGCGVADTDVDADGVADCVDNCPLDYNPDQTDTNGNGLGDACEGGGGGGGGGGGALLIPVTGGSLIGSGIGHSCMTTADGLVICWGLNTSGQLGNATFMDNAVPVFVEGLDSVLRLGVGANHNCALKIDGTVWCWGSNVYGQLGNANTMNSNVPVQVQGLPGLATDITAGEHFNCANIEDGSIWCWGKNMSGQLNDGTLTSQKKAVVADFSTLPTQISGGQNDIVGENGGLVSLWKNKQAFGIEGLSNILNISGNRFAIGGCAAGLDGKVNCWGMDNTPVEVADIVDAIFVGTGQANACAIDLNQEVYCWGANSNGELGNGKFTNSTGGVKVVGLDPITALGVGAHHSCSLLPDGNAMCWGDNTWGQLGNNSHTDSSKPVMVILPTRP